MKSKFTVSLKGEWNIWEMKITELNYIFIIK